MLKLCRQHQRHHKLLAIEGKWMFFLLSTIEIPSELLVVTIVLKLNFLINLLDKFTTVP